MILGFKSSAKIASLRPRIVYKQKQKNLGGHSITQGQTRCLVRSSVMGRHTHHETVGLRDSSKRLSSQSVETLQTSYYKVGFHHTISSI